MLAALPCRAAAQITAYGLDGRTITALVAEVEEKDGGITQFGHLLFAGTDTGGVFLARATDKVPRWTDAGLRAGLGGVSALGLQHWGAGPRDGLHLFAAPRRAPRDTVTPCLYRTTLSYSPATPFEWASADSGLPRRAAPAPPYDTATVIRAIAAWYYTGHTPPQPVLAGGAGVYTAGAGAVFWTEASGARDINAIDVMPRWFGTLAWATGGYVNPYAYVSRDAGATWKEIRFPNLIEGVARGVAIAPGSGDTVYVGFQGVQRTTDGGATWTEMLKTPSFRVRVLCCDPRNPAAVYAGGIGMEGNRTVVCKRSTDAGRTWTSIYAPDDVPVGEVRHLAIAARDSVEFGRAATRGLFLGTQGTGVWVYNIDAPTYSGGTPPVPARFTASILPHPARTHAALAIETTDQRPVHIRINDMLGRTVWSATSSPSAGKSSITLPIETLTPGMYHCTVENSARTLLLPLIVAH